MSALLFVFFLIKSAKPSKENNTRCERYKIKEEGKSPPPGLSPAGKNINVAKSISKQKIVFEETVTQNP